MNIALFTDEESIIQFFKYLLAKVPFSIYPIESLNSSICKSYSYVIMGATQIYEEDTKKLHEVLACGPKVYLATYKEMTKSEEEHIEQLGISGILKVPDYRLLQENDSHWGQVLTQLACSVHTASENNDTVPVPVLVEIGRDTWYHPEQLWVQSDGVKRDLTEKQAKLLQYFLDHEGEVVTKYELADYIWGGYIKPEGIPKFIARLKDKLGPAGALITSRAIGGFLYIRDS